MSDSYFGFPSIYKIPRLPFVNCFSSLHFYPFLFLIPAYSSVIGVFSSIYSLFIILFQHLRQNGGSLCIFLYYMSYLVAHLQKTMNHFSINVLAERAPRELFKKVLVKEYFEDFLPIILFHSFPYFFHYYLEIFSGKR